MKKVLIGVAAGLLSFLVGVIGMYFAMPHVAPQVVEDTRARLDSTYALSRPPEAVIPDSLLSDSLLAGVDPVRAVDEASVSLSDTVRVLNERLRRIEQENQKLLADGEKLKKEISTIRARRTEAESLSGVLSKLEDKQLAAILKDVNMGVLEILYGETSARNQAKLMQSMSPERAAQFVHTLIKSDAGSVVSTESAGSSTQQ